MIRNKKYKKVLNDLSLSQGLAKKKKCVVNEGLIEKRSEKCRIRIIMQVKKKAD